MSKKYLKLPTATISRSTPIIIAGLAFAAIAHILTPEAGETFFAKSNIFRILIIFTLSYLLITFGMSRTEHYRFFRRAVMILVPVLATASLCIMQNNPHLANQLVKEDHALENMQAVLLFAGSALLLITAALHVKDKNRSMAIGGVLLGLVLFVIGMEEVSWLQRVLEVESSAFFLENNAQQETNLHNLSTHLSQNIYYFGAFVLLVLVPFYRSRYPKKINNTTPRIVRGYLPSAWLYLPFSVITGFIWPTGYRHITIMLALFSTIVIIVIDVVERRSTARAIAAAAILPVVLTTAYFTTFDNKLNAIRTGAPTEYTENFIAIGLFIYALDVLIRIHVLKKTQ